MSDRKEMIERFIDNDIFRSLTDLSDEELANISFSENSQDPLFQALKKLVFSYCNEDADITVKKNVNIEIEKNA
jgi:hypothetical protein